MPVEQAPSRIVPASWAGMVVSALLIVQPLAPVGAVPLAILSALGATCAALVLVHLVGLDALAAAQAPDVQDPAPLIRDIVHFARITKTQGRQALSQQEFRRCHPALKFGLGLIASGLEPSFVRSAVGHRLDGIASTGPIATPVSRAIGAGLMFTGATGTMLVEPNLVVMHPARFLILAMSVLGGMAVLGISALFEQRQIRASALDGVSEDLLIEGLVGIASGQEPALLEQDLCRRAGEGHVPSRAFGRAA